MSPLVVGASRRLAVREEQLPLGASARFLYASDLHLGLPWTRNVGALLLDAVERTGAETLLLGGDLVNHRAGVRPLRAAIEALSARCTVAAVPGNHDRRSLADVRAAVLDGGGRWLPEAPLELDGGRVRVDGAIDRHAGAAAGRAVVAGDHASGIPSGGLPRAFAAAGAGSGPAPDPGPRPGSGLGAGAGPGLASGLAASPPAAGPARPVRILCAHEPDVFPVAARAGYAAVLAGHLHGCQFVAFRRSGLLHPGVWFYRWNGLRFADGDATMLVSVGCSDALPLRWNCPREVMLCTLGTGDGP